MFKRPNRGSGLPPLLVASVAVVGCHGGAGTTTVTRMLAPAAHETPLQQIATRYEPLVLVAKGTAYGLKHATEVMNHCRHNMRYGFLSAPPVLVIVADSVQPDPPTVKARIRLLQDDVRGGSVVRLPYVPAWRDVDDPLSVTAPRDVVDAAAALRQLLQPSSTHHTQGIRR
ncbi:hypothetical protein GTW37_39450 [Streptomyces sp. SID4931]|nr:hypothetical protein [Streptomyces sp. SID4931]SCG10280.1 hypothetical protein GA0115255_127286 [Streptomyces sp. Ncost-T6T-2b]